jgi:hypothetical protein
MTGEEADRVDQAVEAAGHDGRADAEERRSAHVVAGDREAVLETGDAATGGVEVGRALGARRRPLRDEQRGDDEDAEHADRGPVRGLLLRLAEVGPGGIGGDRDTRQRGEREGLAAELFRVLHLSTAFCTCSARSSNSRFARRT